MENAVVFLVDADAFFVACTRASDPEVAGRATHLIVGGSADGRGVVASASYEARAYGVRAGMPTSRALQLCPNALVVPVPGEFCSRKSEEIRQTLAGFTPDWRASSIDEWYLNMSDTPELRRHGGDVLATARAVRRAVFAATGMSVSVGCGPNPLVAKMAVELGKPGGEYSVPHGAEAQFMRRFGVADIPGVGPAFQRELARRGVRSVEDGLALPLTVLRGWLGDRRGQWLYDRLRGIDRSAVEPRGESRSISREQTFREDVSDDAVLWPALLALVEEATNALRDDGCRARTVGVKVRDADFRDRSASRTVSEPLATTAGVAGVAHSLFSGLRADRRVPVRLLGVALTGLVAGLKAEQLKLFDAPSEESTRDHALEAAVDRLRHKFGERLIRRGGIPD
jgi:DNA polymerase IV